MGLIDDLSSPASSTEPCKYNLLRESLSEEEQQALDGALQKVLTDERSARAKSYSFVWLADVLNNNGHSISRSTIARHATEECSCFPKTSHP